MKATNRTLTDLQAVRLPLEQHEISWPWLAALRVVPTPKLYVFKSSGLWYFLCKDCASQGGAYVADISHESALHGAIMHAWIFHEVKL